MRDSRPRSRNDSVIGGGDHRHGNDTRCAHPNQAGEHLGHCDNFHYEIDNAVHHSRDLEGVDCSVEVEVDDKDWRKKDCAVCLQPVSPSSYDRIFPESEDEVDWSLKLLS